MELKILAEIAIICATFAYTISQLADAYIKILSAKTKKHPDGRQGEFED